VQEANESIEVAEIKKLGVVVDMGVDDNKEGVIVIHTGPLKGKLEEHGDRAWDFAFAHLVCLHVSE